MTMHANNKRAFAGFRPIIEFLDRHPVDATAAEVKVHRDALDGVLTRMTALAERRESWRTDAQSLTLTTRVLRRKLERELLSPVRRLTREIAGANTELRAVLSVPRQKHLVTQLASARSVASAAREHAEAFTKAGLRPDYATRLGALLDQLENHQGTRARRAAEVTGSVAALQAESVRGRFIVSLLDGLVTPLLEDDAGLLREWQSLRNRVRMIERVTEEGPEEVADPTAQAA